MYQYKTSKYIKSNEEPDISKSLIELLIFHEYQWNYNIDVQIAHDPIALLSI